GGTLTVANSAPSTFSENLNVTGDSATGTGFSATNNVTGSIAPGASSPSTSGNGVGVTLTGGVAGLNTGMITVHVQSDGTGNSGLGTTALTDKLVPVSATGYSLASAQITSSLTGSPLNFG